MTRLLKFGGVLLVATLFFCACRGGSSSGNVKTTFNPRFGLGCWTYGWHNNNLMKDLQWLGAECDKRGIPRGEIYFNLEAHSDAGFGSAGGSWKDHYASRMKELATKAKLIMSYGFGVAPVPWNSNTPGKGYAKMGWKADATTKAFILDQIRILVKAVGWDHATWLLCSENDPSTPTDFRNAINGLAKELGIPGNRVMQDAHPGNVHALGIATTTTDNWTIIKQCFHGSGTEYCEPDIPSHKLLIDYQKKSGRPVASYSICMSGSGVAPYHAQWSQILDYWKLKR